jgi:hypothetical protein
MLDNLHSVPSKQIQGELIVFESWTVVMIRTVDLNENAFVRPNLVLGVVATLMIAMKVLRQDSDVISRLSIFVIVFTSYMFPFEAILDQIENDIPSVTIYKFLCLFVCTLDPLRVVIRFLHLLVLI